MSENGMDRLLPGTARVLARIACRHAATKHASTNETRRYPPRFASWIEEMEKRSRRRTRDLVTQAASRALPRMRSGAR